MADQKLAASCEQTVQAACWEQLEQAWKAWQTGKDLPRWNSFLPSTDEPDASELLFSLIQLDIEHRVKAGLFALLQEHYFDHILSEGQQIELIRWEYQQRWKNGERARRGEYQSAFPHLADALEILRPRAACPHCRGRIEIQEETVSLPCPACGSDLPAEELFPPRSAKTARRVRPQEKVLAGYEILEQLGRGGMGIVYKARQLSVNRLVALKMIRAGLDAGPAELARFLAEAETVARLQHPNIVQVFEVTRWQASEDSPPQPCLVMELVEGMGMDRWIAGIPQAPRAAAELLEIVARAVHYAHQQGIIHRDLKPANILLKTEHSPSAETKIEAKTDIKEGQKFQSGSDSGASAAPLSPRITDFGLAKRLEEGQGQTRSGDVLGTPSYMAPEQARGRLSEVGPATDVYALGAILYECLTGRPPFQGETVWDTIDQVLTQEPVAPCRLQPRVPRDLETICLKCLKKEPNGRYASAEELADDLRRFLQGEPIRARPVGVIERAWRWSRRNPRVAALVAAFLVAVVAGLTATSSLWLLAESRRQTAEEAQSQAEHDREAAEESARRTREAVKDLFILPTEHPVFQVDGMTPARRLLLETASRYFRDFIAQRQNDPALALEVADAHQRLARITWLTGTRAAALADYQKALALYREILARQGKDPVVEDHLAQILQSMGQIQAEMGHLDQAKSLFDELFALRQASLDASPKDGELQRNLATAWLRWGTVQYQGGQLEGSLQSLTRCRDLVRPTGSGEQTLASCLLLIGHIHWQRQHPELAQPFYKESAQLQERLVARQPGAPGPRAELATVLGSLGLALSTQGDHAGAIEQLKKSRQLREKLVEKNGAVLQYRQDLAIVCISLADEYGSLRQPDKQGEALQTALECCLRLVRADPEVVEHQRRLGECHWSLYYWHRARKNAVKELEHLQLAVKAFENVVRLAPGNASHRYLLAMGHVGHAEVHRNARRFEESRQAYQRARDIIEALHLTSPTSAEYRRQLGKIDANIAYIQVQTGDRPGALATSLRVLQLRKALVRDFPRVADYQTDLKWIRENVLNLTRLHINSLLAPSPPISPQARKKAIQEIRLLLTKAIQDNPDLAETLRKELARLDAIQTALSARIHSVQSASMSENGQTEQGGGVKYRHGYRPRNLLSGPHLPGWPV